MNSTHKLLKLAGKFQSKLARYDEDFDDRDPGPDREEIPQHLIEEFANDLDENPDDYEFHYVPDDQEGEAEYDKYERYLGTIKGTWFARRANAPADKAYSYMYDTHDERWAWAYPGADRREDFHADG